MDSSSVTKNNRAAQAPPSALLDQSKLLSFVEGDTDLQQCICPIFLANYPTLVCEIRGAIASADSNALARAAHTFKGSSAYFLTESSYTTVADLETMAQGGDLSNAPERLAELEREMERLMPELLILAVQNVAA